ncbi:beta strand repeat-containing protein, partial [Microbacterium arthrosphaerae]|uniref:beta strand repeat-containing protein n=1 Tax=Microbacterium arthrosphaerae TaxID=792652 RepID=UPI0035EFC410
MPNVPEQPVAPGAPETPATPSPDETTGSAAFLDVRPFTAADSSEASPETGAEAAEVAPLAEGATEPEAASLAAGDPEPVEVPETPETTEPPAVPAPEAPEPTEAPAAPETPAEGSEPEGETPEAPAEPEEPGTPGESPTTPEPADPTETETETPETPAADVEVDRDVDDEEILLSQNADGDLVITTNDGDQIVVPAGAVRIHTTGARAIIRIIGALLFAGIDFDLRAARILMNGASLTGGDILLHALAELLEAAEPEPCDAEPCEEPPAPTTPDEVEAEIVIDGGSSVTGENVVLVAQANNETDESATASIQVTGSTITGTGYVGLHAAATTVGSDATAQVLLDGATIAGEDVVARAHAIVAHTETEESDDAVTSALGEANAIARVLVSGGSIQATGADGDVHLSAKAELDLTVTATGTGTDDVDAAAAYADATATATVEVEGDAAVTAPGDITLLAQTDADVDTTATAQEAGGAIAVSRVAIDTRAELTTTGAVDAGGVLHVEAGSVYDIDTTATASEGGATQNGTDPGTTTDGNATTPDGSVDVAGALAYTDLDVTTLATIGAAAAPVYAADGGVILVARSHGSAATTADASAVAADAPGVGVAVAVNSAEIDTRAVVDAVSLTAPSLSAYAIAGSPSGAPASEFRANATSGAGSAESFGAAGALAIALTTRITQALLGAGPVAFQAAQPADAAFEAYSSAATSASATPGTEGGVATGLGAHVALGIVNDATTAAVTSTQVTGLDDLALLATVVTPLTVTATGGAASDAISTVLALSVSNAAATSRLAPAPDALVLAGDLTMRATLVAPVKTTARGDVTAGDGAAVGVVLALTFADHVARIDLGRDVIAAGDIVLAAEARGSSATIAAASMTGSPGAASATGSGSDPSAQITGARDWADGATAGEGTGSVPAAPSPATPQGAVMAAAAVALGIHDLTSDVVIAGVSLKAANASFTALGNLQADSTATGAPADRGPPAEGSEPAATTIAAALAITLADARVRTALAADADVDAASLSLTAGVAPLTASGVNDPVHRIAATATGGAGSGGDLSVAGSVALALSSVETSSALQGTFDGATLTLAATGVAETAARALLATDGGTGATTGVGASFALAKSDTVTTAALAGLATGTAGIVVTATGTDIVRAEASGSAAGADLAVAPFTAVAMGTARTVAQVEGDGALAVENLTVTAAQRAETHSVAKASVAPAGDAAVGVGLALTLADHAVQATLARDVVAAGAADGSADVFVGATGVSKATSDAAASASGAPENSSGGAAGTGVDGQIAGAQSTANAIAAESGGTGNTTTPPSAETSEGGVNAAAAVAVTVA